MRAKQLAKRMSELAIELSPEYGLPPATDWDDIPENYKGLLVAICRRLIDEYDIQAPPALGVTVSDELAMGDKFGG